MITPADRNHAEATIQRAITAAKDAEVVATSFGLSEVAERVTWALDFLDAALEKLAKEET